LAGDWILSELYLTRAPAGHVAVIFVVHLAFAAGLIFFLRRVSSVKFTVLVLRALTLFLFIGLLAISIRSAAHTGVALGYAMRFVIFVSLLPLAVVLIIRLNDTQNKRLTRAICMAAIAFLLVPTVAKKLTPAPREWISAKVSSEPRATLFLLLDEFSDSAVGPLVDDLRRAGLQVTHKALVPVGKDTQNVVPAMFSGFDFSNVRVCGISSLCSDLNVLDFSAVAIARDDVHVVGQHFPYCDIPRLKSCFQLVHPYSLLSVYRGFIEHFLKRAGIRPPLFLTPIPIPANHQRRLLDEQTTFINQSDFWQHGGILYAHLFLPHPPGMDGIATLDVDYAENIKISRILLMSYVARLQEGFGNRFSIIVTSDHPLRNYWCDVEWYGPDRCATRIEYKDDMVPLIVATGDSHQPPDIRRNDDVFKILNQEARKP
jgi:hypothetical protein